MPPTKPRRNGGTRTLELAPFFDLSLELFCALDLDGRLLLANPAWGTALGYAPEDVAGRLWRDFVHPDDADASDGRQRILGEGAQRGFDARLLARDGSYRWLHWTADTDPRSGLVYAAARDVTDIRRDRDALRTSERRLRMLLDSAPIEMWAVDREGRFTGEFGRIHRLGFGDLLGARVADAFADHPQIVANHLRALAGETVRDTVCVDGRWYEAVYAPMLDARGEVAGVIGVATDVTARRRAEEELRESEEKYRRLVETSNDLIFSIDPAGRVTFVNGAVRHMHGYEPSEVVGRHYLDFVAPESRERDIEILRTSAAGSAVFNHGTEHVRKDGSRVSLSVNVVGVRDDHGRLVAMTGTATDVTERLRFEQELRHMADHDMLTGLLNRRRFEEELERELAYNDRYGSTTTLIVLDVDNFKSINDSLGHLVGDEILRAVAARISRRLRRVDVLARLGGDEFAVLLPATAAREGREVARALLAGLRDEPVVVDGRRIRLTVSAGLTDFGPHTTTATGLLRDADVAMYEAKEAGRDRVAVYRPGGERQPTAGVTWADRIRAALDSEGFTLECQPIRALGTGEVSQWELLVRMCGPGEGEVIPPAAFLPTAERFGLVEHIDRWVLGRAVDLLGSDGAGARPLTLEVNLSGRSFGDPEIHEFLAAELERSRVDPSRLIIEITETQAISNLDEAREFATRLTRLGCRFALDDFGTGFGSFHYLKYLPISYIKLDGDFIRDLPRNRSDQVMVKAMADVARGLGMRTIAEFVETEATLEILERFGVDYAQGYYIGRPQPVASL